MSGLTACAVVNGAGFASPCRAGYEFGGPCALKGIGGLSQVSFGKERRNSWSSQVKHKFEVNEVWGSSSVRNFLFQCQALADDQPSVSDDDAYAAHARELLGEDEPQNFLDRLIRAWSILFPSSKRRLTTSNAEIAKQRLKMILISDRCSVNDEAKRRIVDNIVGALSDFVEIESEDKVQLTVSSDPDLGTVYSVTVPVRRVKPDYQEYSRDLNVVLSEEFRTVDLKLEYHPDSLEGQI